MQLQYKCHYKCRIINAKQSLCRNISSLQNITFLDYINSKCDLSIFNLFCIITQN